MMHRILRVAVKTEVDVLVSRQRARQIAALCGFNHADQVRIATVVSELARNIYNYAGHGYVAFGIAHAEALQLLAIEVTDRGPGIKNLDLVLSGQYRSDTGMGLGLLGAKRLMDVCDITTSKNTGTAILLQKCFAANAPVLTQAQIDAFGAQLGVLPGDAALAEIKHQNHDLVQALDALKVHQDELVAVNQAVVALNAELDSKAAQLQRADVRKDEFLAILAHELRNPLSAIAMAAGVLEQPNVPAARNIQLSQLITRQVGHMSRLVEDLLDVSRVTRGIVAIEKKAVDMRLVVQSAVEQLAPIMKAKGHSLVPTLPDECCHVTGDITRLIQVGSNLLSNAARYTPDGGTITVALYTDENMITLQVTDNGMGIDSALMPRLFDLYVQAERATDGKSGGLGVGLTLVKSIVELHAGSVSAASDGKGRGSCFEVRLPRLSTAASGG